MSKVTLERKLPQFEQALRAGQSSVSLKELAAYLGLSQTTVSRVINRTPAANRIPESTQQRVFEAAAQLKYKANIFARSLRNKKSFTVGVMVPEISEGYSTMVLSGIEDTLLQDGFFYFVVSHRHRPDLLAGYPQLLLSRAVEGMIAIDTQIQEQLPVPVIAISGHRHHEGVINIQVDHTKAVRMALEHLYKLGHRKIAYIKGQVFSSDTKLRWKAICDVSSLLNIPVDPQLTVQLEDPSPGPEPGHAATRKLLDRGKKFTAIFAFNDLSAIGAITALRETGHKVPQDVSVVGFDDILSASTNNPGLTTVHQPLREMGEIAAVTLLRMIRGEAPTKKLIRVLPTFAIRQSTSHARK
ncbi:MAG TPA: LacI family DNA-binding transcriptional regulator [Acidobacteriaceae bacterium]|nr:LacI family DNA-binding transcriptional regulator [Acidobacteriaceae bacterium]